MGACTVRRLHEEGATVVVADILDDEGKALADELGERVRYVHHDVTAEEGWASLVAETERELRPARRPGQQRRHPAVQRDHGHPARGASPDPRRQPDRHVPRDEARDPGDEAGRRRLDRQPVLDRGSRRRRVFCGAYTASKFAVRGITKVAAIENGKDKIRVNSRPPRRHRHPDDAGGRRRRGPQVHRQAASPASSGWAAPTRSRSSSCSSPATRRRTAPAPSSSSTAAPPPAPASR